MSAYLIEHLRPILFNLVKNGVWLAITAAIFVPIERLFALHPQKVFRRDRVNDLISLCLNGMLIKLGLLAVIVGSIFCRRADCPAVDHSHRLRKAR